LAAIDLYFLGPKLIVAESALGAVGLVALGLFTVHKAFHQENPVRFMASGIYMLTVGINYVPLLLYSVSIARDGTAEEEIQHDLRDRRSAARKYRKQSQYILVPLVVLVLAILQELQPRRIANSQ
jgi:hypothetical protein